MSVFPLIRYILTISLIISNHTLISQFETALEIQEYQDETSDFHSIIKINELSVDQLSAHPMIGPEKAMRIIQHRSAYGPLLGAEELLLCDFEPEIIRKLNSRIQFRELTINTTSFLHRLLWKAPDQLRLSARAETQKYGKHSWLIEYNPSKQFATFKSWSTELHWKQLRMYLGNALIQENQGLIAAPPFPVGRLFNLGSWSYQTVNICRYGGSQPTPLGIGLHIPIEKKASIELFSSADGRTFGSISLFKLPIEFQWISAFSRINHAHQVSITRPSFLGVRWNLQWSIDHQLNTALYVSILGSLNSHLQWGIRYQRIGTDYQTPFLSPFKKSEIGRSFLSWGLDGKINKHTQLQFRYHLYETLPQFLSIHRRNQQEIWAIKTEYSKGDLHSIFKLAQTLNQIQLSSQNEWTLNRGIHVTLGLLTIKSVDQGSANWVKAEIEKTYNKVKIRAQIFTFQAPMLRIYAPQSLIYQPIGMVSFKGSGHFYNLQFSAKLTPHWKLQIQYILLHKTQIFDAASPEIPRIFVQLTNSHI